MMTGGSLGSEGTQGREAKVKNRVKSSTRGTLGECPRQKEEHVKVKRQRSLNLAVGQDSGKDEARAVNRARSPDLIRDLGCCPGSSKESWKVVVVSILNS